MNAHGRLLQNNENMFPPFLHSRPFLFSFLILGCAVAASVSFIYYRSSDSQELNIPIPTLSLDSSVRFVSEADFPKDILVARVIGEKEGIPVNFIDGNEESAVTIIPDQHCIVRVPDNAGRLHPETMFDPAFWNGTRGWFYRYDGSEGALLRQGKTGKNLWIGDFVIDRREMLHTGEANGWLHATGFLVNGGDLLYVMLDGDEPVRLWFDQDSDGDLLTDGLEVKIGTNPHDKDSDGDGLSDFLERSFIAGTGNEAERPVLDPLTPGDDAAKYAAWNALRKPCVREVPEEDLFFNPDDYDIRKDCYPVGTLRPVPTCASLCCTLADGGCGENAFVYGSCEDGAICCDQCAE